MADLINRIQEWLPKYRLQMMAEIRHFFWFAVKGIALSIVLIFIAVKIAQWIHQHFSREYKINSRLQKRLPGLSQRVNRYRLILNIGLQCLVYLALIVILFPIWGVHLLDWIPETIRKLIVLKIVTIVVILLAALLIWELANILIELSLTKGPEGIIIETGRTHTLLSIARKTLLVTLTIITFLMVLAQLGVNIGPLLAGAGVLGLAISFGAQKLFQDVITGFFMLLENQISVGDVVNIGDKSGTVESISIRTVCLRGMNGAVHIIPYSSITMISNLTKDFSYALFEVGVAYRENIDDVIAVLRELGAELQNNPDYQSLILEPLEIFGLDKFADSAVVIKARFKTKPASQWRVGREFNRLIKQKFDQLDIQIPFPHTVIFFGENKDHSAPPAHLQIMNDKKR